MSIRFKFWLGGIFCALAGAAAYHATAHALKTPPASNTSVSMPVQAFQVDPGWIKSGQPNFRASEFYQSPDQSSRNGIFECDGPSTFVWHYQLDEAIYVLEGGVEIEYLGKRFALKPGDTAFFKAGTQATWHVEHRIKKAWTLYDPGHIARWLARLLPA